MRRRAPALLAHAGLSGVLLASAGPANGQGSPATGGDRPAAAPSVRPAGPPPAADPADDPDARFLARLDHALAEIDALLATAHFRTALARAEATRQALDAGGTPPQLGSRRARLEVMAATAEIAFGRHAHARESLVRALRADPGLALDANAVSPKVRKALAEARRHSGVAEPQP